MGVCIVRQILATLNVEIAHREREILATRRTRLRSLLRAERRGLVRAADLIEAHQRRIEHEH